MSTYGNFKFLIEGKFINQPDSWCNSYIGRRYGCMVWDNSCILNSYLEETLTNDPPIPEDKEFCGGYYDHLNLKKCCEVLREEIEKKEDSEYNTCYSDMLFSLCYLQEQGLKVDVFYRNEHYLCMGFYGCDTTKQDLESGKVKLWKN